MTFRHSSLNSSCITWRIKLCTVTLTVEGFSLPAGEITAEDEVQAMDAMVPLAYVVVGVLAKIRLIACRVCEG